MDGRTTPLSAVAPLSALEQSDRRSAASRARIAVAVIFLLNGISVASWVVRIPDVQRALALSSGALGVALLAAAGGALVAMPVAGKLVSAHGSRPIVVAMALPYALTLSLPAVAPTLPLLIAALFVNGAANGSLNVAINAHASLVARRLDRPILASFHALFSGGGLAGAALGGLVAGAGVSATVHLAVVGVAMAGVVLVARRSMLEPSADRVIAVDVVHAVAHRPAVRVIILGALAFTVLFAEGAMGDWSAVYLRDVAGAGPALVASGYAAFSVMMALGRVVGDRMTAWLGAHRMVGLGGLLAAAGVTLALFSPSTAAIAVGFGAVGAGLATAFPSVIFAAGRVPGTSAGDGIAGVATLGYFGLLAGPPIIGFVAQGTSLRGGMAAVGLACLVSALLARALRETDVVAPVHDVPTPLV